MSGIMFRRIGGHVVPIKLNNERKQQAAGATQVAAAAGIAVAGGNAASKISKAGARAGDLSYRAERRAAEFHKAASDFPGAKARALKRAGRSMNAASRLNDREFNLGRKAFRVRTAAGGLAGGF